MCLDSLDPTIADQFEDAGDGCVKGWKVFWRMAGGELGGEYRNTRAPRPRGQWLDADVFADVDTNTASKLAGYKMGWHTLATREAALTWAGGEGGNYTVVLQVLAKGPLAFGMQGDLPIGVFQHIFIPEEN